MYQQTGNLADLGRVVLVDVFARRAPPGLAMRLLLLLALPHALALRTAGAGAAGSRPTEASKAAVLVEGMMQRQERLRECTRCWLPLDLCLCADGRIQTGETSRV